MVLAKINMQTGYMTSDGYKLNVQQVITLLSIHSPDYVFNVIFMSKPSQSAVNKVKLK